MSFSSTIKTYVTPAVSNTLGTLGKSMINSSTGTTSNTLGAFGKGLINSVGGIVSDTGGMNQLYAALEKLNSSIETVDKTVDVEAITGRNKADDLYSLLANMDIKSSSDFMNQNREFMKRLMRLNKQEKDITLDALGVDVTGESNTVKNEYVQSYDHVQGNDYYEDYVKTLRQNQEDGDETTVHQVGISTNYNYGGIHNDLYNVNQNLYADDENKGSFTNKWIVENRNSLLYKTKKLFNSKKIKTIISRFHTDANGLSTTLDNAKSKYGLSHGRNLLTYKAEKGANTSYVGGYDNPYCRVWTHHHQYDRYYKTIRPFSGIDDWGNYQEKNDISLVDFHKWDQFSDEKDTNSHTKNQWGWKKESNNGWQYSVLRDNGMVNITPKYVNGEATNIHTKQCMFSIENLAWRGYDPYSFEQALSWEQRGPLGGRIMWFPPYGITFSETTSTQWANNTFLGRGEDIYTYSNTTRTGVLNFMMVVDHPSILDYVTWTSENKSVNDTDILRFLAGCGENDSNALHSKAKPTPLTDEYLRIDDTETPEVTTSVRINTFTQQGETITSEEEGSFCFLVFFPNNYSGVYDIGGELNKYNSKVEPIPYLLCGKGAQKNNTGLTSNATNLDGDLALTTSELKEENTGCGYEMIEGQGISAGADSLNFIPKSDYGINPQFSNSKITKWLYRIDGVYNDNDKSKTTDETTNKSEERRYLTNYYGQTLSGGKDSYGDNDSSGWNNKIQEINDKSETTTSINSDAEVVHSSMYQNIPYVIYKDDDKYYIKCDAETTKLNGDSIKYEVFSLAEVVSAIDNYKRGDAEKEIVNKGILKNATLDQSRVKNLCDKLSGEITSIQALGVSSPQGTKAKNNKLSRNRAKTVVNWFKTSMNINVEPSINVIVGIDGKSGGEGHMIMKATRAAIIFVNTKKTATEELPGTTTTTETVEKNISKFSPTGRNIWIEGKEYKLYTHTGSQKEWYMVKEEQDGHVTMKSVEAGLEEVEGRIISRNGGKKSLKDENRLRYDQEYHFFKVLEKKDPFVYNSLMDKLQYFDPAFHSMTPEGFNGRLTFLQQCMRQGDTVSASDGKTSKGAVNLAFGRAPYCVLRLGDFYNQMIVIDNLSINYDPLQWDLNVEGVGVQPLIAHISLSFKFIGGGDMTGPVRRLQNAMSFNYYANTRLYDNRADRIERKWSDKTNGALEHDEILQDDSREYTKKVNKDDTYTYTRNKNDYTDVYSKNKSASEFHTTKMYK